MVVVNPTHVNELAHNVLSPRGVSATTCSMFCTHTHTHKKKTTTATSKHLRAQIDGPKSKVMQVVGSWIVRGAHISRVLDL